MTKAILSTLLALACVSATAGAAEPDTKAIQPEFAITGEVEQAAAALKSQSVCLTARRISGVRASDAAYERTEAALKEVATAAGIAVVEKGQPCLTVEVASTFYTYTTKFAASLLTIPALAQARLDGANADEQAKVDQHVDVVRVAAGVLGVMRGWVSPAFGSYVITSGAAPAIFGSGSAPTRLFVAGKERYERGEQEVNTKVRIVRDGDVVATFGVRNWIPGDEPPFEVDGLVASNWSRALSLLAGRAPATADTAAPR